jgi:hypothetical protein
MTIPAPITAEQRDQIVALAQQGMTRNAIAKETDVSAGTVTKYARLAGISFDRSKTKAATSARQADSAERRATLAARILDGVDSALTDLETGSKAAREIEQAARSLAHLGRALGDTAKSSPLADTTQHEARDAIMAFSASLSINVEMQRRLEAYEAMHGSLDDLPPDNYGRPTDEAKV